MNNAERAELEAIRTQLEADIAEAVAAITQFEQGKTTLISYADGGEAMIWQGAGPAITSIVYDVHDGIAKTDEVVVRVRKSIKRKQETIDRVNPTLGRELIMGYIRRREGKKGVHYQAKWTDDQGVERVATFRRKTDAEDHITKMEAAKLTGTYIDTASRITVAEYAREYAANRPHRATTAVRVKSLIDRHIDGTKLGAQKLANVRTSQVQGWIAERAKVLSPGTLRLLVQLMRSIFAAAVQDRMLASNPLPPRVSLPRADKPDVVPLTIEQLEALADAIQPRCRAMVIMQAGLGLRIAELLSLRVQDVDFVRGTVRIETQLSQDGKTRLPDLKTPRSKRVLSLPDLVRVELARHIEQFGTAEDGSLFVTAQGNLYRARALPSADLPLGRTRGRFAR